MYDKFDSISYTNSQAVVVSSACTSGSKKTPTSLPRIRGPDGDHPHGGGGWGGEKPPPQPLLLWGSNTPNRRSADFAQKAPAGRLSSSKYNPNTLTRMPPTQYPLSGKAAPPPNSRDAFPSLQQGADPLGWTQGDPREPQGAQGYRRAPSAPLGGWAHGAPWGYTEAIPNGTPFRLEGIYEGKAITSVRKPFEWKGRSEWMALPNGKLCHVFTQPRKRRTECRRIW